MPFTSTSVSLFGAKQMLDGGSMVQRPTLAGALASVPTVIVHVETFLLTFLTTIRAEQFYSAENINISSPSFCLFVFVVSAELSDHERSH